MEKDASEIVNDSDMDSDDQSNLNKSEDESSIESSDEESFHEIDSDWLYEGDLVRKMEIYDTKDRRIKKNEVIVLLHKMLMISVLIDDLAAAKLLMDSFRVNPFVRLIEGRSAFLLAIQKGRISFVKFFAAQNYVYYESKNMFDFRKMINKAEKKNYNNALHLAVFKKREEVCNILLKRGIDMNLKNFKNWEPFEMSTDRVFKTKFKNIKSAAQNKAILDNVQLFNIDSNPMKLYGKYCYVLLTLFFEHYYIQNLFKIEITTINFTQYFIF